MGWANRYIQKLQNGETVQFRPHGNSMQGKIESGDLVTVSPDISEIKIGDIVLCKVGFNQYVHLVKAKDGDRYQIGNNKGHINGWTTKVFGKVIKVEP